VDADRFLRTFDVLELLAQHTDGLRLTDVSQALGSPVSSTHNLLQTMVKSEVLLSTTDLRYLIGPRAVRLGVRIMNSLEVREIGRRHLEKLTSEIRNDIYMAVRIGDRVVYVDRFLSSQPVTVNIRLGESLALHATAVGKLFSAYQPDLQRRVLARRRIQMTPSTITDADALEAEWESIRSLGYSLSREEAYEGIVGIAVPVRQVPGTIAAAIHVSTFAAASTSARVDEILEEVRGASQAIEADLGVTVRPPRRVVGTTEA
jgi:DNA-binding IclR family transcriptional regulator